MLAFVAGPARAQTTSGSIVGVGRTTDGAPVPDAVVQALSDATGALRTAITADDGTYRIDLLSPGRWTVVARLADGQLSATQAIGLGLEQTLHLDFTVGTGLAERVTVTADPPLVDRKETAGQLRVTGSQADTLPVAGRLFTDLALLDSSVQQAAPGSFYGERGSVFTVNGQSGRANAFLVDGLDNNDDTSGTAINSFFSQQVIRELVLSTHQYAPEFGRAAGGVLNIVTHQGGNETNWEVFAQGSPDGLNSPGSFVEGLPDGPSELSTARRWQAGFRVGGPLRRDKAFYFAAFEHQSADDIVPYTGIDREGIAGGRVAAPAEDDNMFVRTDFNLGPATTLMLRASADDRTSTAINVGGLTTPEAGFRIEETDVQLAATLTTVISPRLLSETRVLAGDSSFDQFANSDRSGVTRPSGIFGGNVLHRQDRAETKLQAVQNLTVLTPAHTLKFGLDVTRSRTRIATDFHPNGTFLYNSDRAFEPGECGFGVDALEAQNSLPDGTVVDDAGNPLCRGELGVDDDGDGTVDEPTNILSYPVVFQYIAEQPSAVLDDTRLGLFAQDSWEVGSRLLIDFGLRYDLSTYVLPESARVDSTIPNGGAERDTDNVAPRFGFTYAPDREDRLVVRGGAGIFFDKLVLGFPAVAAITSGTEIGLIFPQGFGFEFTEDLIEEIGIDAILPELAFVDELILRFSTATELDTPSTLLYNLGFERALGRRSSLKANFVRALGRHQALLRDLNPVSGLIVPGDECIPENVDPAREVGFPCHLGDPETGSIAAITTSGRSWYWGLEVGLRHQGERGWSSASYTLSRAENLGFDPLKGGISLPPDSVGLSGERGRADGDRRHRVVLSGDTPLPWLGLRLSGVLQLASGLTFNVTTGQDDNLDGILTDRPPGVSRNRGADTPLDAINELRSAHNVTLPEDQQLAPVTGLSEPKFAQLDLRLYRSFPLRAGRGRGECFVQVFNVFDRENGGLIEGSAISRSFGRVITLAGPPRTLELGLKIGY